MVSLVESPVLVSHEIPFKADYEFKLLFDYIPEGSVDLTRISMDTSAFLFVANAYNGLVATVPLVVELPADQSAGYIIIHIARQTLAIGKNWSWDLLVTDAEGTVLVLMAGSIRITDSQKVGLAMYVSSFDSPVVL